jgi:hypothetical protein
MPTTLSIPRISVVLTILRTYCSAALCVVAQERRLMPRPENTVHFGRLQQSTIQNTPQIATLYVISHTSWSASPFVGAYKWFTEVSTSCKVEPSPAVSCLLGQLVCHKIYA